MEKLLIMSNFSFCHNNFNSRLLQRRQKCVFMWERVKIKHNFQCYFSHINWASSPDVFPDLLEPACTPHITNWLYLST